MTVRDRYRRICALVIGILAASVVFTALPVVNAQSGPFALAGSWSGGGKSSSSRDVRPAAPPRHLFGRRRRERAQSTPALRERRTISI